MELLNTEMEKKKKKKKKKISKKKKKKLPEPICRT